ncbi:ABC-2 family transporter [Isoptericola sp. CG 20/1183]|uniref:ABC-2 family transporter n=1 Tax=Isoptericola halotolerans TaxID=300560 RepID=A0ABX5ECM4_9MICO|nr:MULTISPECIES: ABC transporter permease subunit [Isoptericola]PRZ05145.1 ABC-2 family transporter [Isoptericola halotolerans]PRZ05883.1 ABC-2 family transporter [Isoptericola sp. CG 20/1183]
MSAPVLDTAVVEQLATTRPRIPLARLVDVEFRKLVDTRSSRWLLASVPLLTLVVVTGVTLWGRDDEVTFGMHTTTNMMPLELVLPLVAVLSVAGEWSQRSALTTFALVPRRGRVVAAKAVALLVATLAATATVVALSAVGTVVAAQVRGIGTVWDLPVDLALRLALANVLAVAFGFLVGLAIRSTAPAMVAYLGFMLVLPMVSSVIAGLWDWWAANGAWLDLSWSTSFVTAPEMTGEQWAQVGTSALLWIVVPLALAVRRLLRTEIR